MIDTENLRTASLYINNQLLSRGLLQDGQNIDFSNPARGDGDFTGTMGHIMSVVNDLILRRDRDAEHRESLSTSMRTLRADSIKLNTEMTRLSEKHVEAQRKLDIAEASEAAAKTQLKSADASIRGLKEDLVRTKALVAQSRTACANEVRRRDRQIDTLKKQLVEAGRARGARTNPAITTINVTGDVGIDQGPSSKAAKSGGSDGTLHNETNLFLTTLARNLSEENDAILKVMRGSMEQLRSMSGWTNEEYQDAHVVRKPSWEEMAAEMDSILDHMKNILTNPSFVPIEEVVIREEEINRLKDGWVKMESRWKDAVHLIDGWRKRMASSGRPVDEEELKMGLRLSPVRVKNVRETRQARGLRLTAVVEEDEEEEGEEDGLGEGQHYDEYDDLSPDHSDAESLDLVPLEAQIPDTEHHNEVYKRYERETHDNDDEEVAEEENEDVDEVGESKAHNEAVIEELHQAAADLRLEPSPDSSPQPEPCKPGPLRNSRAAGNIGSTTNTRPKVDRPNSTTRTTTTTTTTRVSTRNPTSSAGPSRTSKESLQEKPKKPLLVRPGKSLERSRSPSRSSLDDELLPKQAEATKTGDKPIGKLQSVGTKPGTSLSNKTSSQRTLSRSRVTSSPPETESQEKTLAMSTIAAKLAASEREADAARVRAKIKAARGGATTGVERPPITKSDGTSQSRAVSDISSKGETIDSGVGCVKQEEGQDREPEVKVEKRKRDRKPSKTASRRRSTLSPQELETLISGNVE